MAAGHPRLDRHPLTHLKRGDLGAYGRHDTTRLMAQDERRVHHVRTDPAVLVVVHVGPTHADRPDLNEDLVGGLVRNGPLLDIHLAHPAQHADLHR